MMMIMMIMMMMICKRGEAAASAREIERMRPYPIFSARDFGVSWMNIQFPANEILQILPIHLINSLIRLDEIRFRVVK
jgi:hypothetical protein